MTQILTNNEKQINKTPNNKYGTTMNKCLKKRTN